MSKMFDATAKELLESYPESWIRLLLGTDVGHVRVLNFDPSMITAEAGTVLQIEAPAPWLVHVEFRSSREGTLPLWLQRFSLFAYARHGLPVQSIAVLLHPRADGPDLTGRLQYRLPDGRLYHEFWYKVVRVWELPVEEVMAGAIGTTPIAPLTNVTSEALPEILRRIEERSRYGLPEEAAKLRTATRLLMGLRNPKTLIPMSMQEIRAMVDSVTYQADLDEGRIEEAKQLLLRMGRKRFGPPEPRVVAAIESIAELGPVELLVDRLLDVASWDELLVMP
jgi:hypothetical protein